MIQKASFRKEMKDMSLSAANDWSIMFKVIILAPCLILLSIAAAYATVQLLFAIKDSNWSEAFSGGFTVIICTLGLATFLRFLLANQP